MTGDLMRFTICVNMAGIPAISVPVGLDAAGVLLCLHAHATLETSSEVKRRWSSIKPGQASCWWLVLYDIGKL